MKFMLCYAILCYVMLCYVMLCYVMLCYAILCYAMLCITDHVWTIFITGTSIMDHNGLHSLFKNYSTGRKVT